MLPRDLLRKIRRIEIRTARVVNDVLAGQYHSAFKGRGMEFEEVRPYQIGDDVRTIDWNVSARYGEPFVKVYREERELTVVLLVDVSRSHLFGTAGQLKRDLVAEVCATLAFSAIRNNDKVGLMCFSDRVEKVVPPRKGTRHVLRVVREVLYYRPQGVGTDLAAALEYLNRVLHRRGVVFLVSDFQASGFERPLRIARRRHDLIPILVADPREVELPPLGLAEFVDAETGNTLVVDLSDAGVRRRFAEQARARMEAHRRMFRAMDVHTIDVMTGQSFVEPLTRYFRGRRSRP